MAESGSNAYAILLAGGTGTRLWPVSRQLYPKQLVKFTGDDSLVQSTVKRLTPVLDPEKVRIVCGEQHLHETARHMQENAGELLGSGDHADEFIARLNLRSREYAELSFTEEGPSYPFMRHLGFEIQQLMGAGQENRWVIDQVMDKDAPEVYKQMKRILRNLFM